MCNVEQSQVLFVVPSGMLDSITSETGLPVTDYLSKHSDIEMLERSTYSQN